MAAPRTDRRPRSAVGTETGSATLVALLVTVVAIPLVVVGVGFWASPVREPRAIAPTSAVPLTISAPPDAQEPSDRAASNRAPSNRALFFGDSLFIGGGYTTEKNSMARLAANRRGYSRTWINGGGGTGYVTANPDYGLPTYLGQIRDGAFDVPNPGVVVIEGGNNDRGYAVKTIRRNAGKVIRAAQRKHPQALVVVLGPIDSNADHSDLAPIMRAVRKAARTNDVAFVNGLRWLEGRYDLIGPDYDHPIPKGHRILGRKLAKALQARGA